MMGISIYYCIIGWQELPRFFREGIGGGSGGMESSNSFPEAVSACMVGDMHMDIGI